MHIAVDMDDVILDFVGNLCSVLNIEYDAGLSPADITKWELADVLDEIVGESWWDWWERRDWLWALAPAIPGSIGGLERLRRDGHYLELLTSTPRWAEAQRFRWLGKWRPPVQRVTLVQMGEQKHDVSEALVLVDDRCANVQGWVGTGRPALFFSRPHNESDPCPEGAVRVSNWKQVIQEIERIEEREHGEVRATPTQTHKCGPECLQGTTNFDGIEA